MVVARPASQVGRDGMARPVDAKVQTRDDDDLRQPGLGRGFHALRSRDVKAAHHVVRQLLRRVVDHAHEHAGGDQLLHGRAADPIGMKNHASVTRLFQVALERHHRRRRVAQHRHGHEATAAGRGDGPRPHPHHPGHGRRRVAEDGHAQWIQPQNVNHRVHDHYVARADERPEGTPPRGQRADHQLGHPDRQHVHGRGTEDGSFRTAQAENPGHTTLPVEVKGYPRDAPAHAPDGGAAGAGSTDAF